MARELPLSNGLVAIVDDWAFDFLSHWKWTASRRCEGHTWYAHRNISVPGRSAYTLFMHRQIMCAPAGLVVDHINWNGLDNRRENLRLCTQLDNRHNRKPTESSMRAGVVPRGNRFEARITRDGIAKYLGRFDSAEEASLAYQQAASAYIADRRNAWSWCLEQTGDAA